MGASDASRDLAPVTLRMLSTLPERGKGRGKVFVCISDFHLAVGPGSLGCEA